jgi:hypothetical protein
LRKKINHQVREDMYKITFTSLRFDVMLTLSGRGRLKELKLFR